MMINQSTHINSILKFLCLSAFTLLCADVYSQKQANVWHLGNNRTIDFSSGEPVETLGSAISAYEGCASYCDSLGNILFYSNGGGYETLGPTGNIWNAANESIYDMQGIEGGGLSSMQSSVFIDAPGELGKYYLFTMDDREYYLDASDSIMNVQPQGRGLSYFKIDKSLNNGLGGVTETESVYAPSAEGLCAVKHTNGNDYWILINQDSSGIGIYSVTSAGVQLSSVFNIPEGTFYMIKASPDGTKIFVLLDEFPAGMGVLLQFDPATGILSNPQELSTYDGFFYFEFSPNSRYLYFANGTTIGRYDLSSSNIANTYTSFFDFSTIDGFSFISQMQLGPDGKLYILFVEYDTGIGLPVNTLNRISCPNTASPVFEYEVLTFIGNDSTGNFDGLPNFPAWIFENYDDVTVSLGPESLVLCESDFPYTLDAQNPGSTYQWSNGSTIQTIEITAPGSYSVQVTNACGIGTDTIIILPCSATSECLVFEPTGATQTWTVPEGVDSISVKMWGAAGGSGSSPSNNGGGGGGFTEFTMPVVPGDVLEIEVGSGGVRSIENAGGIGGWPSGGAGGTGNRNEVVFGVPSDIGGGGGGGGRSLIRMTGSLNQLLAVAGAGGGAAFGRYGGGGGGLEADYTPANNTFSVNGFGGTQTAGGAPGNNEICSPPTLGSSGSAFAGGAGATDIIEINTGGGGGGDGYFGGGGGSSQDGCFGVGSTGGGGSGFICSTCPGLTGTTQTAGFFGEAANSTDPLLASYPGTATGLDSQNGGGGLVQICYTSSNDCLPVTLNETRVSCGPYTSNSGVNYSTSGVYTEIFPAPNGCDTTLRINLTVNPIPVINITTQLSGCDNSSGSATANVSQGSPEYSYVWSPGGGTSVSIDSLSVGDYSVIVSDANGCTSSGSGSVGIVAGPQISVLPENATITVGDSIQLSASGGLSYSWSPSDYLSCSDCPTPMAKPQVTTIYNVTGFDAAGCFNTALVTITVEERCDELFIPTIFSPNGKGPQANETFCVFSNCVEQFKLAIHNRWGEKIFESEDISKCWDGTFKGIEVQSGLYAYNLFVRQRNGTVVNKTGTITLVK
jgi:gliding motility-associated-like protein